MSVASHPDASLIGQAASRTRLTTPALILDLDRLEANIATMAAQCRAAGIGLRPHAKTHKSVRIARLQLEAGALGACCATVGEAEILARAGIGGVLVTSPLVVPSKVARLAALHRSGAVLLVVVDHPRHVADLDRALDGAHRRLPVLVDVDPGLGRTGVASLADAVALARAVADSLHLEFAGLQSYAGHLQHVESFAARADLAAASFERLRALIAALRAQGLAPRIVSGGGTGTSSIDAAARVFTELQAGSYAVMDVEYEQVELAEGGVSPFAPALFVQATVISNNAPGMATTDAGLKRFATDGPRPRLVRGAPDGSVYALSGDEHGCIVLADASQAVELGAVVECVVPHCDPTVNLYDAYHCVRGERLVDLWPVDARGAV
jgi:3-hydroxy-D-aspartate aldolase